MMKMSCVAFYCRSAFCSVDFFDKEVDAKLSGGEIKKVELATTIARNPMLAIYDEPDTGIDLWTIGPLVDLLKKEQREHGTTTIIVSHNEKFLKAADEVILLKDGAIAHAGIHEFYLKKGAKIRYVEKTSLENKAHLVLGEIDQKIASMKLNAMNMRIDTLTKEQVAYLSSWQEGT